MHSDEIIVLPFVCILSSALAYQGAHYRHYLKNNNDIDLNTDNFSEDELKAINSYKAGANSRYSNSMNDIFDAELIDRRRLFGWVSKLLRKPHTPKETSTVKPKYEDAVNDKIYYLHLTKNLTENLTRLTNVLDHFTRTIKEKSSYRVGSKRVSRSITDTKGGNSNGDSDNHSEEVTLTATRETDNESTVATTKKYTPTFTTVTTDSNIESISGRRNLESGELKNKLISTMNDTLNVIQYEIKIVSNVDDMFADRLLYKIGYIAGSLTAIKGFVDELQSVVNNGESLNDKYVLEMYDTVNKIKEGSGRLLDLLNVYVDKETNELE